MRRRESVVKIALWLAFAACFAAMLFQTFRFAPATFERPRTVVSNGDARFYEPLLLFLVGSFGRDSARLDRFPRRAFGTGPAQLAGLHPRDRAVPAAAGDPRGPLRPVGLRRRSPRASPSATGESFSTRDSGESGHFPKATSTRPRGDGARFSGGVARRSCVRPFFLPLCRRIDRFARGTFRFRVRIRRRRARARDARADGRRHSLDALPDLPRRRSPGRATFHR